MHFDRVLELVHEARLAIPVVLFSYLNPIVAAGPTAPERAAAGGVHGILVTRHPSRRRSGARSLVGRTAGSSASPRPPRRMPGCERSRPTAAGSPTISRLGVTGVRDDVPDELPATVARLRHATTLPICVGFGILTPSQARRTRQAGRWHRRRQRHRPRGRESVDAATRLAADLRRALDAG